MLIWRGAVWDDVPIALRLWAGEHLHQCCRHRRCGRHEVCIHGVPPYYGSMLGAARAALVPADETRFKTRAGGHEPMVGAPAEVGLNCERWHRAGAGGSGTSSAASEAATQSPCWACSLAPAHPSSRNRTDQAQLGQLPAGRLLRSGAPPPSVPSAAARKLLPCYAGR